MNAKDMNATLEHANITVSDPDTFAEILCRLFDWNVRWSGPALNGGRTVHVGSDNTYLALYTNDAVANSTQARYRATQPLNHLGIVVDDLDRVEQRVKDNGMVTSKHDDYEPGRRFYVETPFAIELEVVSYR